MSVADTIRNKLEAALSPAELEIEDQSYLHKGHAGAPDAGESHFRVRIVSAAFEGKTRLQRHKMVNEILAEELAGPVHALTMMTEVPS
ncbi:BolA family protein [Aquisalinus flavus]|uniref:BolA family transcriptional regulator n=1 Tax=Aquisalinus flavus TaxID=1526572 RepID=A0A8J2Y4Y8_9PROT|nr:BolA family protein [Aquisalinus flavus]MBD0427933.1 BolA family transcriptional regulator [Aquisalinus flavus]UNE47690.1 BolA family transcriptional regulator [Aquisalinus flavus]GGD05083.1 BolA family transcriptional regulator [Aquisalinus flavus]